MGSRNEDDDEAVGGEVKTAEEQKAEEKRMAIREKNRGIIAGAIFSRLSRFPIVNVWLKKKVSTSREVVGEEKGLFDDLVDHEKSFNRLLNINRLLRKDDAGYEADALAEERRLAEEERKAKAREADDRLFAAQKKYEEAELAMKHEYDLQILKANYKIQLDPLEKAVEKLEKPSQEPKKTTARGRSPKMKARDDAQKRYEKETARIEKDKKLSAEVKKDLKNSAAKELEVELEKIDKMP